MTIQYHVALDWLRYSVPLDLPLDLAVPVYALTGTGETKRGRYGYTAGVQLGIGAAYWSPDNPGMKRTVEFTGIELDKLRGMGCTAPDLLRFVLAIKDVKISRMDIALDIRNDTRASAKSFYLQWMAGVIKTRARRATLIGDTELVGPREDQAPQSRGDTCYIGSRQSEKMLRVYDKGLQLELPDKWVRMENELKDRAALNAATEIITSGLARVACSLLQCGMTVPKGWIYEAIHAYHAVEIANIGRKDTDWEAWVKRIVIPAITKAYHLGMPEAIACIETLADYPEA